ncbi:aldose 1-epimerase family protein [Sphingomonas sp. RHCKR47]|uniref:aldose 1-epimerase family protein n=1 Tax=Sphingomonas citricola TaxID=2862498 RepID=UPI001CA509B1|nr:aldose 1-epimerase family protein [Sphingomonas citricola]MBW6524153.1 aldose 1-epimerase family protein [Sphingomonas citricola]
MSDHPPATANGWLAIASDQLSAAINPHGAELSSIRDAVGRELMTDADPRWWTGRAPILFPVVGKPAGEVIRVDGREYPMKQHGFARRRDFDVVAHEPSRLVLSLRDDEETRASYPFAFQLEAAFTITAATLEIAITLRNPADVVLPASFGFHPAFAWPLPYGQPREDHRTTFDAAEPEPLRVLDGDGQITAEQRASPLDGQTLHLTDDLFARDALIWDRVRSQSVGYGAAAGPSLEIAFPDTPMLGIWTKPGAPFVCIEPWHGIADPVGYAGEFRDKPGVFTVAPADENRITMSVTVRP